MTKAELAARGNYRRGLDVLAKLPPPPPQLSKAARREYRRTGKALVALGLLTVADRNLLSMYASTVTHWGELRAELAALPPADRMGDAGLLIGKMADRQARLAVNLARSLGCTPASRARIQPSEAPPPPRGGSGWDQFGGKGA